MSANPLGRRGRGLPSRLLRPRLTAYRKITKAGNSLYVAVPRPFLHNLGLLRGDFVQIVLDEPSRRCYLMPWTHRARHVSTEPGQQMVLRENP